MKKLLLLLFLLPLFINYGYGQSNTITSKVVNVSQSLFIRGARIDSISADTLITNKSDNVLVTQKAVKTWIGNLRDTTYVWNVGSGVRLGWGSKDTFYIGTFMNTSEISFIKNNDSTVQALLGTSGISGGTYTWPIVTFDTKGRGTSATSGATNLTSFSNVVYGSTQATSQAVVWHQPVAAATTTALSTNTYSNGTSGVGATLTCNTNGALVIDGYTVITGDRVLIKDEGAPSHNGIYTVTQTGSVSTPFILTRGSYSSVPANMAAMSAIGVQQGSVNGGKVYVQATTGTIVFGTTSLVYNQISGGGGSSSGFASVRDTISQTSHGFSVGNVVSKSSTNWVLADTVSNYADGVVSKVIDANTFEVTEAGKMTWTSGLTVGTTYFSSTSAGALTSTSPLVSVPIGKQQTTTTFLVEIRRPFSFASTDPYLPYSPATITSTGTTTLPTGKYVVILYVDATSGNVTVTLNTSQATQAIAIKRKDSSGNTVTIQMSSGNIDGSATKTISTLGSLNLKYDGTNAWIF